MNILIDFNYFTFKQIYNLSAKFSAAIIGRQLAVTTKKMDNYAILTLITVIWMWIRVEMASYDPESLFSIRIQIHFSQKDVQK